MPKPYAYGKIVFFGTIANIQDWSTGFAFTASGTMTTTNIQEVAEYMVAQGDTWWRTGGGGGVSSICTPDTNYQGCRTYWYPAGSSTATLIGEASQIPARVGNSPSMVPTTVALVASTMSGRPGRSFRGRMYLPATGLSLGAHLAAAAAVDALATSTALLISELNVSTGTTGTLRGVIAAASQTVPITSIRVDTKPDTQRRRGDKIQPDHYGSAAVNTG